MVKRERITLTQANACIDAYQPIPLRFVNVDLKLSLSVVNRFRIYAYDAYPLACALQLGTPLLTLDGALATAAATLSIDVLEI